MGPFRLRLEPHATALLGRGSYPAITDKNKTPDGCLIFMADGEGFEPPVELPPQRFSRPPHSTALPTIRNCSPPVFQPAVLMLRMSTHACIPLR